MEVEELIERSNRQEVSRLKGAIVRYLRKWPWMLLSVFVCMVFAFVYLKFIPKQYNVEAKVLIKQNSQWENPGDLLFGGRFSNRYNNISDKAAIFKSFPLVKNTLEALDFDVVYKEDNGFQQREVYGTSPIIFEYDRGTEEKLPTWIEFEIQLLNENEFHIKTEKPYAAKVLNQKAGFGELIKLGSFSFVIRKSESFAQHASFDRGYFVHLVNTNNSAYSYRSKLQFGEVQSFSSILTMSMKTELPQKTIDFMNTLIEKYIDQDLADKNEVAKNTVEFIDGQLAIISDSLDVKEKNLEEFKSSEQMTDVSIEGKLLIEKYSQVESEKAKYEVMQQYYNYLSASLEERADSSLKNLILPSAFGIEDQVVNELVRSLIDLYLTEAKLIQDGNTKNPVFNQIRNRKKEVMKALDESIDNLSSANKIILNNLRSRADEIDANVRKLPITERKLVNLNRLLKLNENIYLFLMEKRSSAAITMSSNTPDCKVIEPAMLNPISPIAPKRRGAFMAAFLLGLFLPLSGFILVDFLNDTIKDKDSVISATQVPVMGLIPKSHYHDVRFVVSEKPKSGVAESFRIIRTNLSFFQKNKYPFVIMLTSTVAKEGKTFCAINLASVLAASGKQTILLGLDMRKPQLHNYLGIENDKGVSHYLSGNADMDEIIRTTTQKNLYLINAGSIPPNPAELLIDEKRKEFFNDLKQRFDYIIIDTPPVGLVTDALILKEESDLNLYVVRQGYSKTEYLDRINDLYVSEKMPNMSILINEVDKGRSYNYGYYEEKPSRSGLLSRWFQRS
ncbi:MAG TPA: hypothetical protein DCG19_13255 [Cryomorphaceae bacterium]|nr:hypothetical protein [Owenweeksia sp.]MBF99300.1 hypothetical protein [Owenweeksia sp.]HAD98371.1 hypothetical protein [Cryomorphaceae bacterium]HBF21987.1 hypothetical protein [Cryomorphaceae bacterium]HCQ16128.1 hypothetical protein [Cryomorphaceae bacterium]|tara:strand:+ start:2241 stop:4607 length:2367 start_codon:yes stop_codon:yes gene_type:complete